MSDQTFSIDAAYGQPATPAPTPSHAPSGSFSIDAAYGAQSKVPGHTTDPTPPTPTWSQDIASSWDRIRNLVGAGPMSDPNYRGRNPDGSLTTAADVAGREASVAPTPQRNLVERAIDSGAAMVEHYSPAALAARVATEALLPDQAARVVAREREFRQQEALQSMADPVMRDGDSWYSPGTLARFGANLVGGAAGGLISDPTTLIAPGGSWLAKVGSQAAIGGVTDAATQGAEIGEGTRDTYNPVQTAIASAGGATVVGLVEAAPAIRAWWRERGVNVDTIPDAQLVSGSLDGSIGGHDAAAELRATLGQSGATPEQFSTPELARAAADRAAQAQTRVPPNIEGMPDMPRGQKAQTAWGQLLDQMTAARQAGDAPARTVPNDVSMIAAPEGTIRSDDAGGMAAVERTRAANDAVIREAQARAANDPTVAAILSSNASPQQKIATVWDRIKRQQDEPLPEYSTDAAPPPEVDPYKAPTKDVAAAPRAQSYMDRVRSRESGGNDTARNPNSSAQGRYQFTDSTWLGTYRNRFGQDGKSDAQVLALKNDAALQETLMRDLTAGNSRQLKSAGFADDDGNLYLTHFLGGKGGVDVLKADPNTPVINIVGRKVVEANRSILEGKTAGEVVAWAHGRMGGKAPEPATPYRAGDYSAASGSRADPYSFDAFDAGQPLRDRGTDNASRAEIPETFAERQNREAQGGAMATGTSTRPFRAGPEDAQWEARANATADELHAAAMADLDRRWQERQANEGASQRFEQQRANTEQQAAGDPAGLYGGKYDQRPTKAAGASTWNMTDDGFIAGKTGNPVAFRNARDAAKWAASEKLGGDFEFVSYGGQDRTGKQRVSLKRRDGSNYGQQAPETGRPSEFRGSADYDATPAPNGPQRALAAPEVARAPEPVAEPAAQDGAAVARQAHNPEVVGSSPAPATEIPEGRPAPAGTDAGVSPENRGRVGGGTSADGSPPKPAPAAPSREPIVGQHEQVVTARGRPVDTQFEVHEARDLISSDHPAYDQRFQPRDRSGRSSSDAQVADISSHLDPQRLKSSREAAQGAPIIGPDRMVESGNGRVASIRRAYDMHPERAAEYRAMIERDHPEAKGFDQPMLVRKRTTAMDDAERGAFVREANERDTMGMSSTEQAKADARTMPADTLELYRGGAVTDAGNREFVRSWMDKVASPAERNQLMMPDGTLSADGVRRIRSSTLAKAFEDADLIAKIVEDPDTEIRAIGNALTDAAPGFAKLRERVEAGELPREYDITPQVAEAANMIATARQQGKKIGDAFKQDDMFGGRTDPITEAVGRLMFKDEAMSKPRSAADISEGLRFYLDEAAKHSETDMFGGSASPERALDILDAARAKLDAKAGSKAATLFQRANEDGLARDRGTGSLADELNGLRDHPNAAVRGLAGHLRVLVGDAEVAFGEDLGRGIRGLATLDENGRVSASVRDRGDVEAKLHEGVHVATLTRYGELVDGAVDGKAVAPQVRALDALRERAAKAFERRPDDPNGQIAHALTNTDEFLAAGLTSPAVQKFLQRHNAAGLWGRFVDGVRSILALPAKYGTLLDRVLEHGSALIERMHSDAPRAGGGGGTALFSKDGGADERSWGAIGDLIFDREFRNGDARAAAGAMKDIASNPKGVLQATGERMRKFGETVAYSTDAAFRSMGARMNAPTLAKLADVFHAEAGVTSRATERTFDEAVARGRGRFLSQLDDALQPHRTNDAAMGRIRDLLAQPNKSVRATPEERAAAGTVRDLLAEVLEYRKDAGEAIGEVKDGYFPRMLRQDRVFAEPDKFLAAAEAAYRQIGATDPKAAAAAYRQRNIDGHLGIGDGVGQGAPGASTAKAREFGAAADEHLRDFYDTNPLSALTSYLTGAVKRAEETRRFGAKGREGSAERAAWEKEHGDKTQWDVMRGQIQDELRANGQREPGLMDRIETLRTNSLGKSRMGSPRMGATVSVIHAWNQLSTLPRSMVASLPEMAMGFVRAGPRLGFTHLQTTLTELVRNIRKLPPSDAARYAEAVGAIGADNSLHLLRARADDVTANAATTKLLDQFYRKNGLEQWTRGGRTAAVKTAQRFIAVLADDMAVGSPRAKSRAAGYLRELGVKDAGAFAEKVRSDTPSVADLRGDSGHAAEYATALLRFANQTVLMPSRSVKPSWASHPLGSLVFALQSYNYAFKKQVLDRVGREAVGAIKERDPVKLSAAAGMLALVGMTAAVQGLRHAIWGSPVNSDKDTPLHYTLETLDRSGMFGAASPLFNAFDGLKYQRSVGQSLQGSVLGRTSDALDAFGGLVTNNNPNTNSAERKAAAAFYDMVINPAESAIGAGVLRGGLGSAVVLGHGVRNDNGLLPADRAAFVDAFGGEKPEQ